MVATQEKKQFEILSNFDDILNRAKRDWDLSRFQKNEYWSDPWRPQFFAEDQKEEKEKFLSQRAEMLGLKGSEKFTFVHPSATNVHVATPLQDFLIGYARSRSNQFLETICPSHTVPHMRGKYWRVDHPEPFRVNNLDDDLYYPGDGMEYPKEAEIFHDVDTYECLQTARQASIPFTEEEEADYEIKVLKGKAIADNIMLRKAIRSFAILTDTGSMTNGTSTTYGGGKWDAATSTNRYIQTGIQAAMKKILSETYYGVNPADIYLVINPEAAMQLAQTSEIMEWVKYTQGVSFLQASNPFSNANYYGLPVNLFGVNVMVAAYNYVTSEEGAASTTTSYLLDDDAVFVTAMQPGKMTMNTLTNFEYKPMSQEEHTKPEMHKTLLQILHNYVPKLTCQASGLLVTDIYD